MQKKDLRGVRLFLFDMDGTLYIGNRLFPFTPGLLQAIRQSGNDYLFITNNSSKSVNAYVEKLNTFGIAAAPSDFLTSSQATAYYLKHHGSGKALYVCGTESLKTELRSAGFTLTEDRDAADGVIMGFDTELTFRKLDDVCYILSTKEVPYIATNPDLVCPTEYGSVPDCGSVCEMIFNATGKRPYVIGKPAPLMIELAMQNKGVTGRETAVVGDRIYTDIKSGLAAGAVSVLVMSGETTPAVLAASPDQPDLVLQDAGEIIPYLTDRKSP